MPSREPGTYGLSGAEGVPHPSCCFSGTAWDRCLRRWEIKTASCFVLGLMFNTGIGQHILKNPLIVNSIIDKVGVEGEGQSACVSLIYLGVLNTWLCCVSLAHHLGKLRQGEVFKASLRHIVRLTKIKIGCLTLNIFV